ncbi:hypothetical protein RHMOL_Rhmol12G0085200 [Rhododendron molle]|uniref:Uncharacterized protein n=1 Tax=Rhododendron molle TaxID=49168 RepID=A0ACC0LGP9_RHOML|nr:hypothetical protein RHMOL_Rhmol12G0085200 [Rhododendron molle]
MFVPKLLHEENVDFINADGRTMNKLLFEWTLEDNVKTEVPYRKIAIGFSFCHKYSAVDYQLFSVLRYTRRKRRDNEKKEEQKRAYCLVTIRVLAVNGLRETTELVYEFAVTSNE